MRTISAIFGARSRLDGKQRADLNLVRIEVLPVNALGVIQQIGKRQGEQLPNLTQGPIRTYLAQPGDIQRVLRRHLSKNSGLLALRATLDDAKLEIDERPVFAAL